ncbi:MAG: tripartite tricarboxylate transporter substrate binding protein [Burkholderiales bacterium]|nr:tripartite tricarboxylate transporter substrate binding protein [Burkholderiales bacterium]
MNPGMPNDLVRRALMKATLACCLGYSAGSAADEAYPNKPIRLLIPFPAGGPSDIMARQIVQVMSKNIGQPFVVMNVVGAAGIAGTRQGALAAPDGYTVILGGTGTHTTNEFLYSKLPYDPEKDFIPLGLLYKAINVFLVSAESPFHTLQDLIKYAKAKPGELNFAIGAIGSSSHLAFEKFRNDAGLNIVAVPYKGMPAAYTDLIGGRIQVMPNDVLQALGQIESGKVRALAVTSAKRLAFLPAVPTVAESGFPDFEAVGWAGLFVPANTSRAIVQRLSTSLIDAMRDDELLRAMAQRKVELTAMTQSEFASMLKRDREKWAAVIRAANIKLD